jgi:hypothetical protein
METKTWLMTTGATNLSNDPGQVRSRKDETGLGKQNDDTKLVSRGHKQITSNETYSRSCASVEGLLGKQMCSFVVNKESSVWQFLLFRFVGQSVHHNFAIHPLAKAASMAYAAVPKRTVDSNPFQTTCPNIFQSKYPNGGPPLLLYHIISYHINGITENPKQKESSVPFRFGK